MNLARRNRLIKAQIILTKFYKEWSWWFNDAKNEKMRYRINALDGRIAAYSDETYPIPVRGHWTPEAQAKRIQWLDAKDFEKAGGR